MEDIKALGAEAESRALPVVIEGVVTGSKEKFLVVQDSTGGIYVDPTGLTPMPRFGEQVRVEGMSGQGAFAPIVKRPRVAVLGTGVLPVPRLLPWDHLLTGHEDNQWVEVEGVVRGVNEAFELMAVDLVGPGGTFRAWCPRMAQPGQAARLVDARVRLRGVYGLDINSQGQLFGFQVHVPESRFLEVLLPGPADPFALPLRPVGSLLQFQPNARGGHRVHVRGEVLLQLSGGLLYLRDETGCVRVELGTVNPEESVARGQRIDVLGFPVAGEYGPVLRQSIFRVEAPGGRPQPVRVQPADLLTGKYEANLVQLEATLLGMVPGANDQVLTLQAADTFFEARHYGMPGALGGLRVGSQVELAGICRVELDQFRNPQSFFLILPGPSEVRVLQRPGWWTPARLQVVSAVLGGAVLLASSWVLTLRSRVRAQTRRLEEQLVRETELEERYRTLVESSPIGIWHMDLDGRSLYANSALAGLLGVRTPEDLAGRGWSAFLSPGMEDPIARRREAYGRGEPAVFELDLHRSDGELRQVLVSSSPVPSPAGGHRGVICSAVDVTAQKQLARELAASRDAAVDANRLKSEFLATMSHEIRTPLNGILGMADLLQQARLDPRQKELADTIVDSGQALLAIVNDILDLAKIEAGRMTLVEEDFDLRQLAQGVVDLVARSKPAKPVLLRMDWDPSVAPARRGDAGRLRQVLLNLVGNARKFTEAGSVVVVVRAAATDPQDSIRCEVVDTGPGIRAADLPLLFQSFRQADASPTRKHGGTGLGLAISRRLVELMGGRIGVESEEGRGSRFWFEVPLRAAVGRPAVGSPESLGLRVLMAHDQPISRRTGQLLLERLGCRVETAASADEVRQRLEAEPFEAAIVSVHLPGLAGTGWVGSLRTAEARREGTGRAPVRLIALLDVEPPAGRAPVPEGFQAALGLPLTLARLREALAVPHG